MSTLTKTLTQTELKSAIVRNPLVVTAETTVMDAIAKMSENDTGDSDNIHLEARSSCVLVIESEKIIGMMTERDVVRLSAQLRSLDTMTMREVMTSPVITLRASDFTDLFVAINMLQQSCIRHLVMIGDRGELLGIVTHSSLLQALNPLEYNLSKILEQKVSQLEAEKLKLLAERDAMGEIIGYVGTITDISDRKQAELAIQESEARFRYLADYAPVLIWMSGLDKLYFHFNKTWLDFTGRTMEQESGNGWAEGVHPDDSQLCLDVYMTSFDMRQSFELEYRIRRFDGEYRWMLNTGIPRFDAEGEFLGYIGSCTDISDRKQVEQEILENQRFIQKIAESSPNILYLYDLQQHCNIYCNREITASLGYTPKQIQAMGAELFATLMHPEDLAKMPDYYQQIEMTREGDISEIEYRMRHADGNWRWLYSRDSVFSRDENGYVKLTIGTAQDITDRKLAESHIQQTTAQLLASNQELEAFAYSVSHDLRAPLRAIDGFSNALMEDYGDKFDAEAKDYFDRIRRNINRMGMLIDDLLRLSRVSRSEMQYINVNLSALVREQVNELQVLEPAREVEVIIIPNIFVLADITLMRVVISNLVQNAWKFTSHHPTSRIEFGVMQQEDQLTYFIRDDGAGFDMAFAKMLFGVFQRLHNTNEFAGTGIGLATVQRAIHRHGGRVWAEGFVEKGATIYFTVPYTSARIGD
jgi:PAS domain S-box-containing protein